MQQHWPWIILIYIAIVLWAIIPDVKTLTLKFTLGVLLFPIVLPAWLIAAGFDHYFLMEFRFRKKMDAANRLLSRSTIPRSGTIIVDSAGFNYFLTQVWWTPDDINAVTPAQMKGDFEVRQRDEDIFTWSHFDSWLWNQYLNPDSGGAKLIFSTFYPHRLKKLKARYPNCSIVKSHSAYQFLQKSFRAPNNESKTLIDAAPD